MNLYKIEQTDRRGDDVYSRAVVCANTADDASKMHPRGWHFDEDGWGSDWGLWASHPSAVKVTLLGVADPSQCRRRVICSG